MNIAKLAIKRPILISSIVAIILIMGGISFFKIGMELIPDVSFPTISVMTEYSGASPEEIAQLITKPLEDELGTISGLKRISSQNIEGYSIITLEFFMEVNTELAAQDVRDKINIAKNNLPDDLLNDPVVQKFDPDSEAVITLALISDMSAADVYDLAKETIKPQIERLKDVGKVDIVGGSRREIQVELDQNRMNEYMVSMTDAVTQIGKSGSNVPVGKKEHGSTQTVFRAMGEYNRLDQIGTTLISFAGDVGKSVNVNTLGTVKDGIEDVKSSGYIFYPAKNDPSSNKTITPESKNSCVYLEVVRQSGKNTVEVAQRVKDNLDEINSNLKQTGKNAKIIITQDQSKWIKTNVNETVSSIMEGIILAVLVVYLFLGNIRSTIITVIAIPNSLLGAVIIMNVMGYTFNMMTLMALSLVVGLLVDDAIVVRENIFRKLEEGENSFRAAEKGTTEVMLAVIATTLAILSVFFPIGMLSGVIGKLFKQFGFTVVFAMIVSLFDALTVAPFLSAYFAGDGKKADNFIIRSFEKFQTKLDEIYLKIMNYSLNHSLLIILFTLLIFISSIGLLSFVKKTFFPSQNRDNFNVSIEMPSGTSITGTEETLEKILSKIKGLPDADYFGVKAGSSDGEVTKGTIQCFLKEDRKKTADENKDEVRKMLTGFSYANPIVNSSSGGGPGGSPFTLVISGHDLESVEKWAETIKEKLKIIPDLVDFDTSIKKGNPELRIVFDQYKMQEYGVSNSTAGKELRYDINGAVVGQLRQAGVDYDIRARLKPEQRDLRYTFNNTKIPNNSGRMVPLNLVADAVQTTGFAEIDRQDKSYIVKITANLRPTGALGNAMSQAKDIIKKDVQLPPDITYSFSGEGETLAETASSILFALVMAVVFIYLVLASLYESFITPFTILLAIPPALTGAMFALFLTGFMLDMFSMIGMVMLMGLVTKNSILLVDNAVTGVNSGLNRKDAILQAGQRRLRPILMTTFAMLAGMLPLALGIGKAAKMRQSMGISIMGGIIISTIVTLIVVPAVFEYIDRFRSVTESKIIVREDDSVFE